MSSLSVVSYSIISRHITRSITPHQIISLRMKESSHPISYQIIYIIFLILSYITWFTCLCRVVSLRSRNSLLQCLEIHLIFPSYHCLGVHIISCITSRETFFHCTFLFWSLFFRYFVFFQFSPDLVFYLHFRPFTMSPISILVVIYMRICKTV